MTGVVTAGQRGRGTRGSLKHRAGSEVLQREITQADAHAPGGGLGSRQEAEHFRTSSGEPRPQEVHLLAPRLSCWLARVWPLASPASPTAPCHVLPDRVTEPCSEFTVPWDLCGRCRASEWSGWGLQQRRGPSAPGPLLSHLWHHERFCANVKCKPTKPTRFSGGVTSLHGARDLDPATPQNHGLSQVFSRAGGAVLQGRPLPFGWEPVGPPVGRRT